MKHAFLVCTILAFSMVASNPHSLHGQASNPPSSTPASSQAPAQSNPQTELLKSPNAGIRARAARDLGKSADTSTIPALASAVTDPSAKVRREVVITLAQMHQPAALDPLIRATKDADDDVRVLAVRSLVGYYTGNVPTPGFTGFVRKTWQRAKGHFTADNTRIDPGLPVEPNVVSALDAVLKDARSGASAREAAKGLGILVASGAVPDLVRAAHSSDSDLAREALNALAKIKDKAAGPPLIDLLDSPNKDIKRDASVTIGILRTQEALPKLQTIFEQDPDQKDKEKAIEGLGYLGQQVSVPLFTKALWSDDKSIRASAAEGLARAADPKTLPELEKALIPERDADAKLAMEFAAAALGRADNLNAIVSELATKMRGAVAQAYLIELSRNATFLAKLYPYLQSPEAGVRKGICTVLMFNGDRASLEQLDRLEHDPDSDVVAESLRAKRAIRTRLAAPTSATTGKTGA